MTNTTTLWVSNDLQYVYPRKPDRTDVFEVQRVVQGVEPRTPAPTEIDLEGLKLDETNNENLLCAAQDWAVGRIKGWNACIDHLAAKYDFVRKV